jgi:integrase
VSRRTSGEGSIYLQRDGLYAAYVWVTTPAGLRRRKYVYGKTREMVREKWLTLHQRARQGPVATTTPSVATYLAYWLAEIVEPNLRPLTAATYETMVRLYITPWLGRKRLERLTVRDLHLWLNRLRETCQCCAQGKDTRRREGKRRCCAVGKCCRDLLNEETVRDARKVLRSALGQAVTEELISKNVASLVRMPRRRKRRVKPWSVDEVRTFFESARIDQDPMYAAYVLILVLGLRKGEVLGLTWPNIDLGAGEVTITHQLQRVRRELLHRETKTEGSAATLPLPDICVAALEERRGEQQRDMTAMGDGWYGADLVFTTRYGTPVDPRNFNRSFTNRCGQARVRVIRVHDARHTCATMLAALEVHPRVAMQIMRHSQISITMEIYTDVYSEDTRAALHRLSERLGDD